MLCLLFQNLSTFQNSIPLISLRNINSHELNVEITLNTSGTYGYINHAQTDWKINVKQQTTLARKDQVFHLYHSRKLSRFFLAPFSGNKLRHVFLSAVREKINAFTGRKFQKGNVFVMNGNLRGFVFQFPHYFSRYSSLLLGYHNEDLPY